MLYTAQASAPARANSFAMRDALFDGPHGIRWHHERRAFWLTLVFAPLTAAGIGFFLREQLSAAQTALIIVVAMLYVSIARGRLLGASVRVHERQFPELFTIVERCARQVGIATPHVFVRDDPFVCITAMGLGPPYALIVSSDWLPHLDEDALTFLIGRELGHIRAGHTRISALHAVGTGKLALRTHLRQLAAADRVHGGSRRSALLRLPAGSTPRALRLHFPHRRQTHRPHRLHRTAS